MGCSLRQHTMCPLAQMRCAHRCICANGHDVCPAQDAPHGTQSVFDIRSPDCRIFKTWWAWVLVDEVGLNFKIMSSLLRPLVATAVGDITECPSLLWPLVTTAAEDITECPSLLWPWVAMGWLCQCTRCYFGSPTRGPNIKLFNMASEMGQYAIDPGYSKDTFSNMQASPVTIGSKKKKMAYTDTREINFILCGHCLNLLCC
jgi:hypothetical protein